MRIYGEAAHALLDGKAAHALLDVLLDGGSVHALPLYIGVHTLPLDMVAMLDCGCDIRLLLKSVRLDFGAGSGSGLW